MEPVPAPLQPRTGRPVQPRLRAAVRNHGACALGGGGVQLLRARHRQYGNAGALRHGRTQATLAGAAAARRDPLRLCDDRTGGGIVRCDQYRNPHRARWRALCDQWPQMVDFRRRRSALPGLHRDGQDRFRRAAPCAAIDDPGAGRRAGPDRVATLASIRLRRCAARPLRNGVRERAGTGLEHPAGRRPRLRNCPGPPGAGPHPPLHARHRRGRARAGTDGAAADDQDCIWQASIRPGRVARTHRRIAHQDRYGAPAHPEGGLYDGHGRQQGGPVRNRHDQGFGAQRGATGAGLGYPGPRRGRRVGRFPLAYQWAGNRTLRLADGPDEVHRNAIAKLEIARFSSTTS